MLTLIQILTNLEELSFLTVLAFPKASRKKDINIVKADRTNNFKQKDKVTIALASVIAEKHNLPDNAISVQNFHGNILNRSINKVQKLLHLLSTKTDTATILEFFKYHHKLNLIKFKTFPIF